MNRLAIILLGIVINMQAPKAQGPFSMPDDVGSGNCLEFDGNDRVSIPNDPSLNFGTNDFSFELWMKIDPGATFSGNYQLLCKKTDGVELYEVQVNSSRNVSCHFGYPPTFVLSTTLVDKDVWYHLAVVRQSGVGKLYVNGVQEGTVASTQSITGASNVFLGMDATGVEFLPGVIDEVRIWNTARTQTEIKDNMCKKLQGNEAGLVGYWNMNEGSGSTITDLTSNNNDGTLQ